MKYPKTDPNKNLMLARLETWLDPDIADDPDAAQQRVDNRLKKWVCSMVTHYISFLLALQVIAMILMTIGVVITVADLANDPGGKKKEGLITALEKKLRSQMVIWRK